MISLESIIRTAIVAIRKRAHPSLAYDRVLEMSIEVENADITTTVVMRVKDEIKWQDPQLMPVWKR